MKKDVLTVGELQKFLRDKPKNLPIVLSRDPEGNEYSYALKDSIEAQNLDVLIGARYKEEGQAVPVTCIAVWPVVPIH